MLRLITFIPVLILIPFLSWGLGENIKNNKDAIKEKIQDKAEGVRSNNNNPGVSLANKELIHQFKNDFTTIEELEETLASTMKEQGKDVLFQDIQTTIVEKVVVAENLYKNLNEDDLKEITNLLISLRALDKTSYLSLFDVTSQKTSQAKMKIDAVAPSLFNANKTETTMKEDNTSTQKTPQAKTKIDNVIQTKMDTVGVMIDAFLKPMIEDGLKMTYCQRFPPTGANGLEELNAMCHGQWGMSYSVCKQYLALEIYYEIC